MTEPDESEHVPEVSEVPEVIPTVVVGKKKVKKVEVQKLAAAEPPEAPPIEVEKPNPKKASRARTKPPPPTPEPISEPTPAPKKAVRMKKAPVETTLQPYAEPASSKRLLTDLNDFSARIQELRRMNE